LTITWHFYKGVVGHIKLKIEPRCKYVLNLAEGALTNFRILDKAQDKVYSSIDDIV